MKDFIGNLFSDSRYVSMMRLLSFICVVTASIIAFHAITVGSDLSAAAVLCSVFLGAGMTGKVVQKISEVKNVK